MKKKLLIVTIMMLALSALMVGTAAAEGEEPPATPAAPYPGMGRMGGRGIQHGTAGMGLLHEYMEDALADKLGLTEEQVEEAFASGSTMFQIALDNGIAEEDLPAFLNEVHEAALAQAVIDGVLTQEQADFMLQRMANRGYGTGLAPQDGTGLRAGRGGRGSGTCIKQVAP